jgi:methionine synthase / methylenetetrahydrofolate reductase (NADH)
MREPFLEKLKKEPLVCDGAMGTMLYSKGIPLSRCYDELNLTAPATVKELHLDYIRAGADILETNTFGATRVRLQKYELGGQVRDINLAGTRLARQAAGEDRYVAGAVGPLGVRIEPLGPTSLEEARAAFREQISALVEGQVDLILIETMVDVNEAHQALLAAREVSTLPVVVQMTIQDDCSTPSGTPPEDFARQLDEWGADVIGLNCSVGPATVLEALERMCAVTAKVLAAQPNAGLPRTVNGRSFYLCSPQYMAGHAPRFLELGARIIGGCCGTTPEHIRAIKAAVLGHGREAVRTRVEVASRAGAAREPVPVASRSRLGEKLVKGEFPVLVEVLPPKGSDPAREIESVRFLLENGIETVNIPDSAGNTGRMSSLTLGALVQQRTSAEVLLHYSCRDRGVLGIQSDLLGGFALGLRNILATTYEASQFAMGQGSSLDVEVDSIGLVNILANLNRGLDFGANPLGTQTSYLTGVWLTPGAANAEEELKRFEYKVRAGANFAVTPPVFGVKEFAHFLRKVEGFRIPVIAGITPLTNFRHAEFLNNEVPGISIPEGILERMRKANAGDQARQEGVKIAQEILADIRSLAQGVQFSAPFGRCDLAVEVAQALPDLLGAKRDV